jgi:acetyl esterase/lipase
MLIRATLAATLAGLMLGAIAHAATPGETLAGTMKVNPQIFSQGDEPMPSHPVAFLGGVTAMPDLTYSIVPGYRPLKLDLYLPPASFASKGPRPTVVFIHGGGWVGGGPRLSAAFDNWPTVLAAMSARGYVVAAVSYRFSGEAPSPAAIQDVKSAIRFLRVNAGRYGVDKNRVMTWGGSAGGQLAALAATSCGVAALEPSAPAGADIQSDCVQGAVTWYGIFDFTTMPADRQPAPYLGCGPGPCTADKQRQASAAAYLGDRTPPMLMIHGADDHTVPVAQSQDFHKAMQARGLKSDLLVIPDVDHSFIGKTPDATRAASKQALARTIDFIDSVIGDGAR